MTWQVRLAYNWRDEFLTSTFDASGLPNPIYTEAYGQFDANFSYNITDNLTVMLEAINLTDEIQRLHGRDENNLNYVTQIRSALHDRSTLQLREVADTPVEKPRG